MDIRKKFKAKRYLYSWGKVYDPRTGDELKFSTDKVFCKTSWVWILTYQKTNEDIPKAIRFVFVDELHQ